MKLATHSRLRHPGVIDLLRYPHAAAKQTLEILEELQLAPPELDQLIIKWAMAMSYKRSRTELWNSLLPYPLGMRRW